MDSSGRSSELYPGERDPCSNRARIANPAGGPDQFHAKRGYFHTRCSGKGFYGIICGIRVFSEEIQKTLTGIYQWPNSARIVVGQRLRLSTV